jgi:hypothetical protein
MRFFYVILCCLVGALGLHAQKVEGIIVDDQNQPLATASVYCIGVDSEDPIKTTLTDERGHFEFELNKPLTFRLLVQALGFEKKISTTLQWEGATVQVPVISLQKTTTTLQEVSVVGKKKAFVEQKIDRIVVNPDVLISNAGLTALEVLEKAPGVRVDMNGIISLKGKQGILVYVDDKPTYLSEADLASFLRSMPSSSIETIEVISNPPARYEAAGNSGIINIRTKKNKSKGFNGGVNLAYGQGTYARTNNSINFNYHLEKWNFFSNVAFSENNTYQDLTITRKYFDNTGNLASTFTQNSYIKPNNRNHSARFGADYYANKKTTIGVLVSGFYNPSNRTTTNDAVITDATNQVTSTVNALNPMAVRFKNGSLNLNLNHKLNDKGQEIMVNTDYIAYDSKIDQNLFNEQVATDGTVLNQSQLQSKLPSTIKIATAKVDYSGVALAGGTLDMGTKSSYVKTNNMASFFDVIGTTATPNYDFSNDFTYQERIHAGYLNYAKDFKKWTVQAGLRLEYTHIDGFQSGNPVVQDSSFVKKYTSLFPTLFVQYRLDSLQNHVFGISMGRRIERPDYKDLNPFTYPMDRFTYYGGNPYLQPTFSYNAELSHTFRKKYTTTVFYSYIDNVISETNEQRGTTYYSRPGNFAKQINYGVNFNAGFNLYSWWTVQLYAELTNSIFSSKVYTETLNDSLWSWVLVPTNQFTISKRFTAELSGQYQSKALSGQFIIYPITTYRAGLAAKILKNKGTLKLNVSDILYSNQVRGDIRNIANAQAGWYSYFDSRVVTLSFSYRFSKGEAAKQRQTGASDTEQRRVKV